jgi:hypothetical protein
MGQAKRRGTYEQRKAEAITLQGGERKPRSRRMSRRYMTSLAMMQAMSAWNPPAPNRFS